MLGLHYPSGGGKLGKPSRISFSFFGQNMYWIWIFMKMMKKAEKIMKQCEKKRFATHKNHKIYTR